MLIRVVWFRYSYFRKCFDYLRDNFLLMGMQIRFLADLPCAAPVKLA